MQDAETKIKFFLDSAVRAEEEIESFDLKYHEAVCPKNWKIHSHVTMQNQASKSVSKKTQRTELTQD